MLSRLMGLFRRPPPLGGSLYDKLVLAARRPVWYLDGEVPDSVDGRFRMLTTVVALAIARLEREEEGRAVAVTLTEAFVNDMDTQLRQDGYGDTGISKRVRQMVAAVSRRVGALSDAPPEAASQGSLAATLVGAGRADAIRPAMTEVAERLIRARVRDLAAGRWA